MSYRILLLGRNGQVGWELERSLQPLGEVVGLGRKQGDLSEPGFLTEVVRNLRPHLVINAAAYTAVDRAEEEEGLARVINGEAVGLLAHAAHECGALLVHYSTDYVFDGSKVSPYVEDDQTAPLNAYGRTKLAGEEAIRASGCAHLIFRTSWVYSHRGHNFLMTMRKLMVERDELRIVSDQIGAPTSARVIADTTTAVLTRINQQTPATLSAGQLGTFHLTCQGSTTWFGFAEAIRKSCPELHARQIQLLPIPGSAYPTPARRPANSRLDCNRLQQTFGLHLPNWQEALRLTIS